MGFASVLLASLAAFSAAIASALGGNGFWMAVLVFYGAGFGTLALLIGWQLLLGPPMALQHRPAPALRNGPLQG